MDIICCSVSTAEAERRHELFWGALKVRTHLTALAPSLMPGGAGNYHSRLKLYYMHILGMGRGKEG